MFQANLPQKYWGEALLTATYLINRIPHSSFNTRHPSSYYMGHNLLMIISGHLAVYVMLLPSRET